MTKEKRKSTAIVVYAMINPAYPGYIKVGKGANDLYSRPRTMNQGIPIRNLQIPFFLYDPEQRGHEIEKYIQELLIEYRVGKKGEWFKVTIDIVKAIFNGLSNKFPGITIVNVHGDLIINPGKAKSYPESHEKYWPHNEEQIEELIEHNKREHGKT